MVEVRITYESLFDLLRRERGRIELQKLDATFMEDAAAYLREKETLAARSEENVAVRVQLANVRKILKELYERRERKIMALALDCSRAPSAVFDTTCLLPSETAFFEDACRFLAEHKTAALGPLLGRDLKPTMQRPALQDAPPARPATADTDLLRIKFLSSIPKFVGPRRQVFGPFGKEEEADLPGEIAKLLIRKGRAAPVET